MPTYYTVDRRAASSSGDEYLLVNDFSTTKICVIDGMLTREELVSFVNQEYPNGISRHGIQYLFNDPILVYQTQNKQLMPISPMVEAIFEQVRRAYFPNLPSRMVSMFAWQTLDEAVSFGSGSHVGGYNIFEVDVDAEKVFVGDMRLLTIGGQVINAYALAHKYWNGERTSSPLLEVLIPLPITLGKSV